MDSQTKRKPNWNADETLALTNLVDENKQILRGKLGPSLTSEMKSRMWRNIAVSLTAMGVGPGRTAAEVEKNGTTFSLNLNQRYLITEELRLEQVCYYALN